MTMVLLEWLAIRNSKIRFLLIPVLIIVALLGHMLPQWIVTIGYSMALGILMAVPIICIPAYSILLITLPFAIIFKWLSSKNLSEEQWLSRYFGFAFYISSITSLITISVLLFSEDPGQHWDSRIVAIVSIYETTIFIIHGKADIKRAFFYRASLGVVAALAAYVCASYGLGLLFGSVGVSEQSVYLVMASCYLIFCNLVDSRLNENRKFFVS